MIFGFGKKRDPLDEASDSAAARARTCRRNLETFTKRAQGAHEQLRRSEAALRAARARFDDACLTQNAVAESAAADAIKQAESELAKARTAAMDADEAVAVAMRATAEADEEHREAQRAKKLAGLREQASPAALQKKLRGPAERILAARKEIAAAAAEMDAAFDASRECVREIRELGEAHSEPEHILYFAPFVDVLLAEDPARAEGVLFALTGGGGLSANLSLAFAPGATPLGGAAHQVLVRHDVITTLFATHSLPGAEAPDRVHLARTKLAVLFTCGRSGLAEFEREREAARQRAIAEAGANGPTPSSAVLSSGKPATKADIRRITGADSDERTRGGRPVGVAYLDGKTGETVPGRPAKAGT